MSTSLAAFLPSANLPAMSDEDLGAAMLAGAEDIKTGGGGGSYLQFSGKTGQYKLSSTGNAPDPEDRFILEPQSLIVGWTCWLGGKPKDRHKWSFFAPQDAVHRDALEDHGPYKASEGWKEMAGFGFVSCDGDATPTTFETTAVSGRNSVSDIITEMGTRAAAGEPSIPVINFSEEKFTVDDNTNWKPMFPVESWVTREAVGAYLDPDVKYDIDDLVDGAKVTKARKRK
ncbi:hypothetical protein OAF54_00670 [bacterium]|nr:hypothetical protein [bacterium]